MITLTEIRKLEEKVTSCLASGKCAISEEPWEIQVEMYRKPKNMKLEPKKRLEV